MLIRRARHEEQELLRTFVQSVADDVYGYLWIMPSPVDSRSHVATRISNEDWTSAWVAIEDDTLIGTVLTRAEWVSDLWVLGGYRGKGVGRDLLVFGEAEIAARGYRTLRLRVVRANSRAVSFYKRLDWQVEREFPHEILITVEMLELSKTIESV
jgi:ribosomal protein S18 acetylase RimI-like enzyme